MANASPYSTSPSSAPTSEPFRHLFRVRYAELDPQGVVFNARYLEYADLVVTEYWHAKELRMSGEGALEFHVANANVSFRKPIRAMEMIEGRAWTTRIGTSSMVTKINLHGVTADGSDDLRAEMDLINVHVSLESGQSLPIPDSVRALLLD